MCKRVIACAGIVAMASTLAAATEVGDKAPEIKAAKWYNAKGPVTLEKLRGQVVLIDYWATW